MVVAFAIDRAYRLLMARIVRGSQTHMVVNDKPTNFELHRGDPDPPPAPPRLRPVDSASTDPTEQVG
jgi:hypothetical protein